MIINPPPGILPTTEDIPVGNDGLDNPISSSEYAHRCRKIMKVYQHLRALGVHVNSKFDLPRVVVIGDQSSGKSSLVEAVTGITVPRDSGTCTRCPMECTMSSDAQSWSCTIEIRNEFNSLGEPLTRVETLPFTAVDKDKSQIELAIRRAQAAVLSPHMEPRHFLGLSVTQLKDFLANDKRCLKFSKNVIQINVRDSETTDLSFVDLPGLIHNAETSIIDTVRQLVEHYIGGPGKMNTLIVIAMPMSDDYEKMEAVRLAKEAGADPSGSRTIGVLTKPDLLLPGSTNSRKIWTSVLEGNQHQTRHGYFCVRLPDDEQRTRGISKAKMEEMADEFFNGTSPWNEISDRKRFGIPNLVKYTSQLLIKLIHDYLPELAKAIGHELMTVRVQLDKLPQRSMDSPRTIIMLAITAFSQDIYDMVFGNKEKQFVQSNRALYSMFKKRIIGTTPDFRPPGCLYMESAPCSPRSDCDQSLPAESSSTEDGFPVTQIKPGPLYVEDVRKVIKRCITWELPRHIPFEATKDLILQHTNLWSTPSVTCFNGVVHNLSGKLEDLIDIHFGQYVHLKKYITTLSFEDRDRCRDEAMVLLNKILSFEAEPAFTQNFNLLDERERHWRSIYSPPKGHRLSQSTITDESEITWTVDDEIKVMANVQAYFHVAYKRFIDYVPLAIEHELNQNFAKRIRNTLIDTLFKDELSGRVEMQRLLEEDPVIAKRRSDLLERMAELMRIQNTLNDFWSGDEPVSV